MESWTENLAWKLPVWRVDLAAAKAVEPFAGGFASGLQVEC